MNEIPQNAVDPDEFVGRPPAGDANPGEFTSNDQSAPLSEERTDEEDAS